MRISVCGKGFAWSLAVCVMAVISPARAGNDLDPLRAQFALQDERIDYADAKLVVDRLVEPATDTDAVMRELDNWERTVRSQVPANATSRQVLDALLRTLYEPGTWNQEKPFTYDLGDPLGHNPKNKQLAVYLATRKGNCVSMPILFAILGQRLGLPVALATAPNHVLVKFADESQQAWLNVEATAGGFKYDSSYERETGISEKAIQNGIYLRPLSPREGVGVIASSLMEHYGASQQVDDLMAVTDMALSANPKDPVALVWKANAYYFQLQERYVRRYPDAAKIPAAELADYQRLSQENLAWFGKAEALGWTPGTDEQDADYLKSVENEKLRRGQ